MRALITGATGLIGKQLLSRFDDFVVLSRNPELAKRSIPGSSIYAWSPEASPPPKAAFQDVDVVFNLAGEPLTGSRWTNEKKRRIRDSRVLGTRNLVAGLAALTSRPKVLVSGSAIGYYGDRGSEELDETSAAGQGFLAEVCTEWEHEAMSAERFGIRVVCIRTGIVLAARGGALQKMLTPFRLGLGGRLGNGRQWMPWIHLDDVVGIMLHASLDERAHGAMNAVGPRPVTNAEFSKALGRALGRPAILRVPAIALGIAFGEMSQTLTASARVVPKAALQTGYAFRHEELSEALRNAIGTGNGGHKLL